MKDRYSGKSRGFGFVTFVDPKSAQRALGAEHTIDGRQCQAKVALPKGDAAPARTTRIFIARIPASVTEQQFRSYFERFGKVQDAYMPKDYAKQGYRGIGFVTFASADSVEKVMATKHTWVARRLRCRGPPAARVQPPRRARPPPLPPRRPGR